MKKCWTYLFCLVFCFIASGCSKDNVDLWWLDTQDIHVEEVWKKTNGTPDILVGVIDSGIDISSEEISQAIYVNEKEIPNNKMDDDGNGFIDDVNGWNFYDNNNIVYTNYASDYHGTMIAGIIAGKNYGLANNIKVLPLKCFRGTEGSIEDIISAIEYAYQFGVRIFNCSWDMLEYNQKLYDTMETYEDAIFVCSSGKNAENLEKTKVYPACYGLNNIIVVGGMEENREYYEYSGYGMLVDVYAPAKDIYCLMPENSFEYSEGTSLAVAFVTGSIVLGQSLNKSLSVDAVRESFHSEKDKYLNVQNLCEYVSEER